MTNVPANAVSSGWLQPRQLMMAQVSPKIRNDDEEINTQHAGHSGRTDGGSAAACGDSGTDKSDKAAAWSPKIDPANFTQTIDNQYFPLTPGTKYRYEGTTDEGHETVLVEVTSEKKTVLGVQALGVHETALLDGQVIEDTVDWFAQDKDGNVWYLMEDTKDLEDGKVVSTEGTWMAGKDGAQPGIFMKANPEGGDTFRKEYKPGKIEANREVLRLDQAATVPYGSFENVLVLRDFSPLEPDDVDDRYYAPGVGLVFEKKTKGGSEQFELVEITNPEASYGDWVRPSWISV